MKMTIDGVEPPTRKTTGSCGYDIHCPKDVNLSRFMPTNIDLGILMEKGDIPEGHFAMIVPRSSFGSKYGLRLRNTVGIIDSDYTMDTIKASLYVDNPEGLKVSKNERILQMIIVPFATMPSEVAPTEERKGGIGSTGI